MFEELWSLVERWQCTILVTVPTAAAVVLKNPVNAEMSSLRYIVSGSAAMPVSILNELETVTGAQVLEGYGMTEATCLVAMNMPEKSAKPGSVGLPFRHTGILIMNGERLCDVDEIGEICVDSPGVVAGATYTEASRNKGLYQKGIYLRTGDLGRLDEDGYLWITGRAKDLIIRGGHNIDPALIEDALLAHPQVTFAGAVGQPDKRAGELPCAYVELASATAVSQSELLEFVTCNISERAAVPKHIEVMAELPKTAVGKVFKPALRKRAIERVIGADLSALSPKVRIKGIRDDPKKGFVLTIGGDDAAAAKTRIEKALSGYVVQWELCD